MPKSDSFWDHPIATLEKALDLRKQIEVLKRSVEEIMGDGSSVAKRRGRTAKRAFVVFVPPFPLADDGLAGFTSAPISIELPAPKKSRKQKKDGRKGKRSAATIAKMKAAQKARWAAKKGGEATPAAAPVKGVKKKRTISPEARAKIASAQRARWVKFKG